MLQVTRNCNTAEWDNFVNQHPSGNILQLFAWAEAKLPAWDSEIVVLREEGKIIAGAQILFRQLPFPLQHFSMAYVPRGPVIDFTNSDLLSRLLHEIEIVARQHHAISLTSDPLMLRQKAGSDFIAFWQKHGYIHAGFATDMREIQPRYNMVLDLTANNGNWRETISATCRSQINKAKRQAFVIRRQNPGDLQDFFAILQATGEREHIGVSNLDYYEHIIHAFRSHGHENFSVIYLDKTAALADWSEAQIKLQKEIEQNERRAAKANPLKQQAILEDTNARRQALARLQSDCRDLEKCSKNFVPLACAALLFCGKTCSYLYGGSAQEFRSTMPVYGLLPALIDAAKADGYTAFDFGGVSGCLDPQQDARYGGLYIFKKHWGAELTEYVGEFTKPLSPLIYKLFKFAVTFRKKIRGHS